MATTRSGGPLDVLVGARIRMCRLDRGMSQTVLAERIGVTFQQVQKFERGKRVGAGRLSLIAAALDVSVGELFESPEAESSGLSLPMRLLKAYVRTTDPRVRLRLARLIQSIADRARAAKATVAPLNAVDRGERRRSPFQG